MDRRGLVQHKRLTRSASSNAVEMLKSREKLRSSNFAYTQNRNELATVSNKNRNPDGLKPIQPRRNSRRLFELETVTNNVDQNTNGMKSNRFDKQYLHRTENKDLVRSRKERRSNSIAVLTHPPNEKDNQTQMINLNLKQERKPINLNSWTARNNHNGKESESRQTTPNDRSNNDEPNDQRKYSEPNTRKNMSEEQKEKESNESDARNSVTGQSSRRFRKLSVTKIRDISADDKINELGLMRRATYPLEKGRMEKQELEKDTRTSSEITQEATVPKLDLGKLNEKSGDTARKMPSRGWSLLRKKLIEDKEIPQKEESVDTKQESTAAYLKMLRERLRRCQPAEIVASSDVDEIVKRKQDLERRRSISGASGKNSFFEAVLTAHALSKQGQLSNRSMPSSRKNSRSESNNFIRKSLPDITSYKTKFQCSPHFQKTINLMGKNDLLIKEEEPHDTEERSSPITARYSM